MSSRCGIRSAPPALCRAALGLARVGWVGGSLALLSCTSGDTLAIDLLESHATDAGPPVDGAGCTSTEGCAAPTPFCLETACVACLVDKDCGARRCSADHECVECSADADCPDLKPHCAMNRCVECTEHSDCPNAETACHPSEQNCVPSCATDTDCEPAKPYCSLSFAVCVQCATADQCGAATPVCDLGMCVQCANNGDCGADAALCDAAEHKCVQCFDSTDCAAPLPLCDAHGKCVQCITDADCDTGMRCDKNQCVP